MLQLVANLPAQCNLVRGWFTQYRLPDIYILLSVVVVQQCTNLDNHLTDDLGVVTIHWGCRFPGVRGSNPRLRPWFRFRRCLCRRGGMARCFLVGLAEGFGFVVSGELHLLFVSLPYPLPVIGWLDIQDVPTIHKFATPVMEDLYCFSRQITRSTLRLGNKLN